MSLSRHGRAAAAISDKTGIPRGATFDYVREPMLHYRYGQWRIGFTGRTQLEAEREGELPYVGAEPKAWKEKGKLDGRWYWELPLNRG